MQLESPERMNDMSDKVATFAQRLREGQMCIRDSIRASVRMPAARLTFAAARMNWCSVKRGPNSSTARVRVVSSYRLSLIHIWLP